MIASLALIFLVGISLGWIFEKLRLPRLVGMLLTGIILGPYALNLLDSNILQVSSDLRQLALLIILIKAGLSLDAADLKKVGRPALLMAFVPATFEIAAVTVFAPLFLPVTRAEAALMGTVLGAVSPAVVVPKMVALMESGTGTKKRIPQMILAGASLDDVYVIVLFTSFLSLAQGESVSMMNFARIPVSIVTGLVFGVGSGFLLSFLFQKMHMRDSVKVVILLGFSCLPAAGEKWLEGTLPVSGLLGVVAMAMCVRARRQAAAGRLAQKFSKLWVAAEIVLFVLVGAAVDIRYAAGAGAGVAALLALSLTVRCAGVFLCMVKTPLNKSERLFCAISYLPKATVQAAIGSVPLAMGLPCGQIILSTAVIAILITAPLGAFLMDKTSGRLLRH